MYFGYCFYGRDAQAPNERQIARNTDRSMPMYKLLMRPSNAVCDAMHITDENERGMIRMLVNMLLLTVAFVLGFVVVAGSF